MASHPRRRVYLGCAITAYGRCMTVPPLLSSKLCLDTFFIVVHLHRINGKGSDCFLVLWYKREGTPDTMHWQLANQVSLLHE